MRRIKQRTFLVVVGLLASIFAIAEDSYRLDVGLGAGGSFYLGDANSVLFRGTRPCFGAFGKYIFNGHWELALNVYGGAADIPKWEKFEASRATFCDVSVTGEFNFFNYGIRKYDKTYSRITPYILAGVGCVFYTNGVAPNIPFGLGVKFKATPRLNLGLSWRMQKLLLDNLDQSNDPYKLNGKGVFNNKDWLSNATISISYNFWKDCAPCRRHKAFEKRK